MTKLVLVLTGVGQAAQSLIIGLGLIRRGSFTRAVLTAGFSCARMLDSLLRLTGAHNVYYVKCTRTFKRHVKAAGFVHAKKLLAHKFDPFPTVTLREFC